MKKITFIAIFSMVLGFTSCGSDDVENVACDIADTELRATVQEALDAYDNATEKTEELCTAAKQAIESYRANECGSADAFATELAELPEDCSASSTEVTGTCVTCSVQGVNLEICKGSNGNAIVAGTDSGIAYEGYAAAFGLVCN